MATRTLFALLLAVSFALLVCTGAEAGQNAPSVPSTFYLNPELIFAGYSPDTGFNPSIAYNSKHDEYLVVWNGIWSISGQRVSSRGELLGQKWSIASITDDIWPDVAYDETNDRYLVTWARENSISDRDLYGRFLPWDGPSALLNEFAIDTAHHVYDQPSVAYAHAQGEFMVVWPVGSSRIEVWGRRIRAWDGAFQGPSSAIAAHATENRGNPDIAYNLARNEYLIVYDNSVYGGKSDIFATRMTANGVNLGNLKVAGWPDDEFMPAVAACHLYDKYLVAWKSYHDGSDHLYAYFVNGDGSMGGIHHLDTSTTGHPSSVMDIACRWGRQYFITWEHWDTTAVAKAIWGRLLYADETMEPSFEIEPATNSRACPAVASSGTNFLVAWEKWDASYPDMVGRIVGDTGPTAKFTIWPPSGYVTDPFQVDATGCSDEQTPAANLQVRWDWTGDGTYDTNYSTTKKFTHYFSVPGTHTVRMQVMDSYGLTDTATDTVKIYNTNPQASFTVNPSIAPPGTTFQFDASASSDKETAKSALEVRWDWENDGTYDTGWSTAKTASHVYVGSGGMRLARVAVRDAQGLIGSVVQQVWIDNKPTATFTVSPARGPVNTVFQFDGSGSSDPDLTSAYALDYRWDWQDDGTYDTSWWQNVTPSHTFTAPGTYTVRLQVRQIAGSLTDTTTRKVTVDPAPMGAPKASFTVTPAVGPPDQKFQVDASGCNDPNGSNAALQVRWDWENDGLYDTAWSTTRKATHVYGGGAGTHTVRMQVKDSEGLSAVAVRTVTIVVTPSGNKLYMPLFNSR